MLEIERIALNINASEEKESNFKAKYIIEPLYRGYGNTVGNALRRVLLSSIPGSAIKGVKITGTLHEGKEQSFTVLNEFSTIEGVKEAVTDIILNIKTIVVKTTTPGEKHMSLSVRGPKAITGRDIMPDSEIEIINPDTVIATITKDVTIEMDFMVDTGEGFVVAEEIRTKDWPIEYLAVDAIYTPMRKVSYEVQDTMVGRITNFDKLILNIETDGSVEAKDALSYAVELLLKHINPLLDIGNRMENLREVVEESKDDGEESKTKEKDVLNLKIDELDLTVRSNNCLKKAGIEVLGDLVRLSIQDLLKIKNLGRKSLTEIVEKVKEYGYELTNNVEEE